MTTTRTIAALLGDGLTADAPWLDWLAGHEVHNLAVAGSTSTDVLARVDEAIALQPALVALMVGTNDQAWREPLDHTVRTIQLVIHRLRRGCPQARLLVHSVLPREPQHAGDIRRINCHVRQYALTVGAEYLDLWAPLARADRLDPECSDDGVTLSEAGYERWHGILADALADADGRRSRIRAVPTPVGARGRPWVTPIGLR